MKALWSGSLGVRLGALVSAAGVLAASVGAIQNNVPDHPVVIYLEEGPLPTHFRIRDEGAYLPLTGLLRRLALPYTDATALRTLTVRGPAGVLEASAGSAVITIDGREVELSEPVFRDDDGWIASLDFLERGMGAVLGFDFDFDASADSLPARIVAGNVRAARLDLEAAQLGGLARLTMRSSERINVRVQQNPEENRVILAIDRAPMIPSRESVDFRNASIRSVVFDDSDGQTRVIVETSPELASVRLVPMEENRLFFVEFVSLGPPPEAVTIADETGSDDRLSLDRIRVVVIDPGHGGLDSGTRAHGRLEKDLTLALARRLGSRLQAVLNGTVILTRNGDALLTGAERSAIANNNEADLLISLHVGFSNDPSESTASLFLMKDHGLPSPGSAPGNLFQPWFTAFRDQHEPSRAFALTLRQRLREAAPGWEFAVREAPLAVLTSATMPAILVELGNANNAADLALLADAGFQARLVEAMAASIMAFGSENAL